MILYRFLNAEYGLESIKNRQLKVSDIMDINDPFEFLGADLSDPGFRKALKKIKKDIAKKNEIICFSKIWKNPLLWSHYADKHKGICLEFEVPRHVLSEIEYVASRLTMSNTSRNTWQR